MKNLKKVLSLVLALAMALSLMTTAFAADASDFKDYDKVTYNEAVDVMVAVGVFNGVEGNNFAPNATLTREQAAKIITYMLVGQEKADKLTTTIAPYSDVPATRWSAGAIAYCTNEGIIAGVGGGKFNPTGELTGLAFAKMLLVALGYDAQIEGLEGSNWAINAATMAIAADLDDGMENVSLSKVLTREEAAQMAFNTMQADLVKYRDKGTNISLSNGDSVVIGAAPAETYANTNSIPDIFGSNDTVQFAEKYCQDLGYDDDDPDVFGRPGYTWSFDGDEIGTYVDTPDVTFTKSTSASDVAKALKGYSFVNGSTTYKVNNTTEFANNTQLAVAGTVRNTAYSSGNLTNPPLNTNEANKTVAARIAESTHNGRLMEIYANKDKEITAIVLVGYGVTEVTKISTNKDGDVTYTLTGVGAVKTYADEDKDDEIVLNGEIAKDDIVTYVKADDGVYYVYPTTKVVGTQTAFNEVKETITVDGTKYDVSTYTYDKINGQQVDVDGDTNKFPNGDEDANYYLDQFGLAVYSDAIAADTKYAVVNAIARTAGVSNGVEAELIFADATVETVKVKSIVDESGADKTAAITSDVNDATNNTPLEGIVYTYTIDKNGKYELTAVTGTKSVAKESVTSADITEKGNPVVDLATDITTNNNTIFVVKSKDGSDTVYNAYTGFKAVPTITAGNTAITVDYAKKSNGAVEFVYIDATASDATIVSASDKGDIVYIINVKKTTENVSGEYVYYYDAIINGEKSVLATDEASLTVGLYKVTVVDGDGVATTLVPQSAGDFSGNDDYKAYTSLTAANCADAKDGVIVINNDTYTYEGKEPVYVIDADGDVSEGSVNDLDLATNTSDYSAIYVKQVDNSTTAKEIDTIYVILA